MNNKAAVTGADVKVERMEPQSLHPFICPGIISLDHTFVQEYVCGCVRVSPNYSSPFTSL